ncbi:coiled-coil domain-containing protein 115 [Bombina bombina]|uniref:coiled-coil domain-containing protein 115 n=1 Tax=Bombina bombina TaxID=8345 RepID=UPI00235AB0EC|nr:coiled-coil domain-containing protein 115 [Bombina bombina]XP_053551887.1 coiled-coil domain-containing protein 115 [Bombina bombina]XP_053551888.1 coiled-coil domain-containing protein 115 [Bombina bombina]
MAQSTDPGEKLTEVCENLDELILQLMTDLEILDDKRNTLNKLIEKGWFSLIQSRYSMGTKFVSPLQYKPDMTPSVFIQDSTSEDGNTRFDVTRMDLKKKDSPPEVEEIGAAEQGLRRRKGATETPKLPETGEKDCESERQGSTPSENPLHWFGILVPQSLRQAQTSFSEGILLAAELASLQSNIEETQRKYRSLLSEKHQLSALKS